MLERLLKILNLKVITKAKYLEFVGYKVESGHMKTEIAGLKSLYLEESRECLRYMKRCNKLVDICEHYKTKYEQAKSINGLGSQTTQQLTIPNIKKLISLCHPDKHGGKALATEMTTLLLKLKG